MSLSFNSFLPATAALLAVLGLIVLAGRLARMTGVSRPGAGRRLAVQDTLVLDRTRRLSIVRCDGRDVLLLTGDGGNTVVGWLPPEGAVP